MTWSPLSWLPWSRIGRQTLLTIVFAFCGPALTACILWILDVVKGFPGTTGEQRLEAYVKLAQPLGWSLIIIVVALAAYISIRSIKAGKDGLEATSFADDDAEPIRDGDAVVVTKTDGGDGPK